MNKLADWMYPKGTPNGYKISILLEELKRAYGLQYTWQGINISDDVQKERWFTAINPNGRIPAIVDHDNGGLAVFEGSAILSYLTRKYDSRHIFSFDPKDDDYTRAESWIAWQHGGLGPMQGQANVFVRFISEKIPFAMQRYVGETERLYGILDTRLQQREFVIGPDKGKFSIADIALLGWVNRAEACTVSLDQFPAVKAWLERCWKREGVQAGFSVPNEPPSTPWRSAPAEFVEQTKELTKLVDAAKEKYGYKYSSP